MDHSPPPAAFRSESTKINQGSAPYTGAFFPRSRNLTVSGGTFISNNYNEHALPPDFRRIPLGDIDLRNEIRLHKESGVIHRQHSRGSVRRMYSAKIHGHKSNMTVALYQGQTAEEEWRDYIAKYSRICHPNFVQIFAAANRCGIHAIVVHDDLMPFKDLLTLLADSPILTVYINGCWDRDKDEAEDYFKHMFGSDLDDDITTFWIRRSTGRLCVDLTPGDVATPDPRFHPWTPTIDYIPPLNDPNSEAIVIDSLDLGEYHYVCYWHLGHWLTLPVSAQAELHLGAVVYSPSGSELHGSAEIAFLPDANLDIRSWYGMEADGDTMEDGWTRYNSVEIFGTTISSWISLDLDDQMAWLSQADHIFHRLLIESKYEDYAIIEVIYFWLRILEPTQTPPNGYLFVYPTRDVQTGPSSFRWSNCPAYWSLDPSGTERLSTDEATSLGFPSIDLETKVWTRSWDSSVYAGLHKFHEGKGFDPDSQDVARHLGQHLYHLSPGREVPFAHVDGVSDVETEREGCSTTTTEDKDEDEDEDGPAPEDVDGEIHEVESEGSSPATNEDEDRNEHTPQDEYASSWGWKAVIFVKLALILSLGFGSLYDYGWAVLAQTDF